jgi:hypothetical protein
MRETDGDRVLPWRVQRPSRILNACANHHAEVLESQVRTAIFIGTGERAGMNDAIRFFYVVRPSLGKWEVSFGENGSCFLYAGKDEAVQVATGAARMHWETRQEPSGVRLEVPGQSVTELAVFGDRNAARNASN